MKKEIMKIFKHFMIRLLIVATPLLLLYFYSQQAIEANRHREHRTDVGLGIAILLFNILVLLLIGLLIDIVYRIRKKQYSIIIADIPFILLFVFPVLYVHCNMSSYCEECFCNWYLHLLS